MAARKGPRVEIRARTAGPYNRAGERWNSAFTEASPELLKDDARMNLLASDPHIEIRVDGEYVSGPRTGQKARREGDASVSQAASSLEGAASSDRIAELERDLSEARREIDRLDHTDSELLTELAQLLGAPPTATRAEFLTAIQGRNAGGASGAPNAGAPTISAEGGPAAPLQPAQPPTPPKGDDGPKPKK